MNMRSAELVRARAEGFMDTRPVVVAMLTYRRPDDLADAIPAILEQTRRDRKSVV